MIAEREIITGERVQAFADVALATPSKRSGHKSTPEMPVAIIPDSGDLSADALSLLARSRIVYVYSDFLDYFAARVFPQLQGPLTLVSGNGDGNVGTKFRHILDQPKLRHWFAQNAAIAHPKLTAFPIGIANAQWPHGDTSALARVSAERTAKQRGVYVNFEVHTNPRERAPILAALRDKPFVFLGRQKAASQPLRGIRALFRRTPAPEQGPPLAFPQYLTELASFQFCVSPPGNGLDCHRTWEALYLGVIPILSRAPAGVLDRLPHIMVDDLRTIEMEDLEAAAARLARPFEMKRLTLSYWRDQIRGRAAG